MSKKKHAALVSALKKNHGDAIMRMDGPATKFPCLPTGVIALDQILGIGGYPLGRIVEVYGPASSGKTTLTLHAIASAQKAGMETVFVDAEHALDVSYARALGVDVSALVLSQPDCGEQGLEVALDAIKGGADLVVIDSVAALTPRAEIEGDMGDRHVGLQARLMSQALRKMAALASRHGTLVIFINQIRHKIGVTFGSPETTTGGNALKFYASVRLDVRYIGKYPSSKNPVGSKTRIKVAKNKMAPPFRECELPIIHGKGFDMSEQLMTLGLEMGIIDQNGSWFSYAGEKIGQGKPAAARALADNEDLRADIEAEVRAAMEGERG